VNWFELDQRYTQLIRVITAHEMDKDFQETAQYFKVAKVADSITHPFAREHGTSICVFQGTELNINEVIKQEVEARQLSRKR